MLPVPVELFSLFVPGIPVAKGSKRAFASKGRAWCVETNEAKQRPWVSAIREAVGPRITGGPTRDAVDVRMTFFFSRPRSHYNRRGALLPSAPQVHAHKPDVDKLARCVLDALTGLVYVDDSQVKLLSVGRYWSEPGGGPGMIPGMGLAVIAHKEAGE